jgi:hypothetical protein
MQPLEHRRERQVRVEADHEVDEVLPLEADRGIAPGA